MTIKKEKKENASMTLRLCDPSSVLLCACDVLSRFLTDFQYLL